MILSNAKRFLLTGATGLVGSTLVEEQPSRFIGLARTPVSWFSPEVPFIQCDLFSSNYQEIPWLELAGIVFLAFPTNIYEVEKYSSIQQASLLTHFAHFVSLAKKSSIPILFFSSDAVLWATPPSERCATADCRPTTVYGKLKAGCEQILMETATPGNLVLRATPIGFHKHQFHHGFLGKLVSSMLQNQRVEGFSQNLITPVSLKQIGLFILDWMSDPKGVVERYDSPVHVTSSTAVSKYELLQLCAKNRHTEHLLSEKSFSFDQTLVPSPGCEILLEDTLKNLIQSLEMLSAFSTKKSPIAK